jgi:hypothetical protein
MTPHQRRQRELEATRRLTADLEALLGSGPIPATEIAAAFEDATSALPAGSKLIGQLEQLAAQLRSRSAQHVGESAVRNIVARLRQRADKIGAGIEARDAKLRARR